MQAESINDEAAAERHAETPLYVPEGKRRRFFVLLWEGVGVEDATHALHIHPATARSWCLRLRRDGAQQLRVPQINLILALRLVFCPAQEKSCNVCCMTLPASLAESQTSTLR